MMNKTTQNILGAIIIVIGFIAVFGLSNFINNNRPTLPEGFEDQDLMLNSAKLKDYSLGFNGLLADWYWMQSLQYIGEKLSRNPDMNINLENLRPLNPRLLYPLLDNATSLDPQYLTAYSYGAIVLPAIDPQQAIKIAEKGIANNPNEWRFHQHLGYIYWRLKDYQKASETYENGAKIAGAPPFLKMMAAQMKNEGGSRETARKIYEQMYAESDDTQTRETAALHLLRLDSLDEQDLIRTALQSFKEKTGRCITNWKELFPLIRTQKTVNGKLLRFDAATFSPVDPTEIPYSLIQNADKCDVSVDTKKSKIPVI